MPAPHEFLPASLELCSMFDQHVWHMLPCLTLYWWTVTLASRQVHY